VRKKLIIVHLKMKFLYEMVNVLLKTYFGFITITLFTNYLFKVKRSF